MHDTMQQMGFLVIIEQAFGTYLPWRQWFRNANGDSERDMDWL